MVVVFIRKNCIQMVFVYFAFWGLEEEFSTLPCSPCFTSQEPGTPFSKLLDPRLMQL
jgi:hypothetical protein